jgi:hypothetical protein
VSSVKYELGFYIPEDDILHSRCLENLNSYIALTGCAVLRKRNVSPVRYELRFYAPEGGILLGHLRGDLKSHILKSCSSHATFHGPVRCLS